MAEARVLVGISKMINTNEKSVEDDEAAENHTSSQEAVSIAHVRDGTVTEEAEVNDTAWSGQSPKRNVDNLQLQDGLGLSTKMKVNMLKT